MCESGVSNYPVVLVLLLLYQHWLVRYFWFWGFHFQERQQNMANANWITWIFSKIDIWKENVFCYMFITARNSPFWDIVLQMSTWHLNFSKYEWNLYLLIEMDKRIEEEEKSNLISFCAYCIVTFSFQTISCTQDI